MKVEVKVRVGVEVEAMVLGRHSSLVTRHASLATRHSTHLLLVLLNRVTGLLGRNLVLLAREFGDLAHEVATHRVARGEEGNVVPQRHLHTLVLGEKEAPVVRVELAGNLGLKLPRLHRLWCVVGGCEWWGV